MLRRLTQIRHGALCRLAVTNKLWPQRDGSRLRLKHTQHRSINGMRNKKSFYEMTTDKEEGDENMSEVLSLRNLEDHAYDEIASGAMSVSRDFNTFQNVLVIQPYVKWGNRRNMDNQPEDQLNEAEALIRSIPNWKVCFSLKVPLESLERKMLFGTGKIVELKQLVNEMKQTSSQKPLTCIFISKSTLTFMQKRALEAEFNLPVMDRYSVVIQILRLHATSAEARLQVAMAELPYIWAQAKDANPSMARKQGFSLNDTQREILRTREKKLKLELQKVRAQRKLLRNKRKHKNFPIVAVVGYTNAGKTSLIKALTKEDALQPRNQLFATLDVTAHAGLLPSNLEVIYMDTVGFMSELPTGLIECFVATLEDAMLADLIIHVQDISHNCYQQQRKHVEETLIHLQQTLKLNDSQAPTQLPPIINVFNKVDLLAEKPKLGDSECAHMISAKTQIGVKDLLLDIEQQVLVNTGRRKMTMRIRNGGHEMAWLYKNAAVVNVNVDSNNVEKLLIEVIIADSALEQFKRAFCQ